MTTASSASRHEQPLPGEGALQQRAVGALERAHEPALGLFQPLQARQHVVGHHRRQRDGDHEAGQDGDDVGLAERREQTAFDAGEGKQRHEHQHDDERGVDDAGANFVGGGHHDIEHRARIALLAVLAQAPEDVLDVDDRIIHQLADGDRQAAKRHRVDGKPHQMKDDGGRQDRDGNGGQRDRGGAPVEQEGEQHDGDHGHGFKEHLGDVVDRGLDEVGLAEKNIVGLDAVAGACG